MKKLCIILAVLFSITDMTRAILTGPDAPEADISTVREYGCHWNGGNLNCTCRYEDTEMEISDSSIPVYSTEGIEIHNCHRVHFGKNSIRRLRSLRTVHLEGIRSLEFDESSLYWFAYLDDVGADDIIGPGVPALKISINNCNITQLSSYTFQGHYDEIRIKETNIESIPPYAFTSLRQTKTISIRDSVLKNIGLQPFKKLSVENLELNNVKADLIPSRMFSNITVYSNFLVSNCRFDTVRPGGFIIYNPMYVEIYNNTIEQLDGEAFSIVTRGNVLFKNNTFKTVHDGAFRSIVSNRNEVVHNKDIIFDSNIFTVLTRDSLSVASMIPKFSNLIINEDCDCKKIEHNLQQSTDYSSEIKCLFKDEYVSVKDFKQYQCSVIMAYSTPIIISSVVLVLLFVIAVALYVYYRRVYLSRKYGSEKNGKKGNLSLIVPDGRTYRETELHVIVERADLLTTDL